MPVQFLEYSLQDGFVNNWLVAGPLARPVAVTGDPDQTQARRLQLAREMLDLDPGDAAMPMALKPLSYAGETLTWRYLHCGLDHFVDASAVYPLWQHARALAYTRLALPQPGPVTFSLAATGPVVVWVDGKVVFQAVELPAGLARYTFTAELQAESALRVAFDQVCAGPCQQQMALRLTALPQGVDAAAVQVRVPSEARYPRRHRQFEEMFEKAYLEEVANYRGAKVNLRWAEGTTEEMSFWYSIQDDQERIYVEGTWDANVGEALDIGHPQRLFERPLWVVLRAPGREYYEQALRYERRMPFQVVDNAYSGEPYGDPASRRLEALEDAARRDDDLYAEIAKMALGKWDRLDLAVIRAAAARAARRESGSPAEVAGMLSMLYRFAKDAGFPAALKPALEESVQAYAYLPGADSGAIDYTTESQQILFAALRILAGQLFPQRELAGQPGQSLREAAEQQALDWMAQRGQYGFAAWGSGASLETVIVALSLLTSLAENESVMEVAAVLLDKILFMLAIHTFHGVYGGAQAAADAAAIKSAQLAPTAGITRLLWGMGIYTRRLQGVVSLACSEYEYPSFFADIAAGKEPSGRPGPLLTREQQLPAPDAPGVNLVTYRTADYMLSSAQDYRPGQPGAAEQVWQATLGPDAVVFANHPASLGDDAAHQPGFWLGNAVLPRVAQWKDALVAVHRVPEDAWLGFTHAFFPTFAFDEYAIENGWAFARKGKGYLAVTAQQGIELVKRGPDGYRELRSPGRENIWLCLMGRDADDVTFSAFKVKVLRIKPRWQPGAVRFTTPRGEELAFGWQGPLSVAGQEQPTGGFAHIENAYSAAPLPADPLQITYGDLLLRLNFH